MSLRLFTSAIVLIFIPFVAQAAAVAPAIIDLSGARGQIVEGTFQIINASEIEQSYYLDTIAFAPREETGEPSFFRQDADGLLDWIQFPARLVRVPARAKVDAPFTVVIPADVASGTYHAGVTVSQAPAEIVQTNGAIIEAMTAVLVFLNVEGESHRAAVLLDFLIDPFKSLLIEFPKSATYRLQNQGNVQFIPRGTIRLIDVFERTIHESDANKTSGRVLPSTTRMFEAVMQENSTRFIDRVRTQVTSFAIGPVTAELNLNLGEGFEPISASQTFWYVPVYFIGSLLLLLVVLVVLLKLLKKRFST